MKKSLDHIILFGFPNYFGSQRMGILYENLKNNVNGLPIGPLVGKFLLQQNYKEAIRAIILGEMYTDACKAETDLDSSQANNARRMYLAQSPLHLVLSLFPSTSVRERTILRGLIRYGDADPKRVIELLPYSAITLYISAYQSYIWNKVCSYRLSNFGFRPIAGDLISDGETVKVLPKVDLSALEDDEYSKEVFRKVVLPLFGTRSQYPSNEVGR